MSKYFCFMYTFLQHVHVVDMFCRGSQMSEARKMDAAIEAKLKELGYGG
ncbi:hypothetical protein KAX22_08260 [bacterium]|nr:hypothetical protein [bacterium]